MPVMEEATIFTDKYRIAALERGERAHIDWTANHQNLNMRLKEGDEIWVYGDTPPHCGYLCIIEKLDIRPIRKYNDLFKMTVAVE